MKESCSCLSLWGTTGNILSGEKRGISAKDEDTTANIVSTVKILLREEQKNFDPPAKQSIRNVAILLTRKTGSWEDRGYHQGQNRKIINLLK